MTVINKLIGRIFKRNAAAPQVDKFDSRLDRLAKVSARGVAQPAQAVFKNRQPQQAA